MILPLADARWRHTTLYPGYNRVLRGAYNFWGPRELFYRFMYIWLNHLQSAFSKVILRFEADFWCLECECCYCNGFSPLNISFQCWVWVQRCRDQDQAQKWKSNRLYTYIAQDQDKEKSRSRLVLDPTLSLSSIPNPGFSNRGAQKIMSTKPKVWYGPYGQGSLSGPWKPLGLNAFSCYLSLISKHSDTKLD